MRRTIDNSEVAPATVMIVDCLMPRFNEAMDFGSSQYADYGELQLWMNGAIYGIVAERIHNAGTDVTADQITLMVVSVSEMLDEIFSERNAGDFEARINPCELAGRVTVSTVNDAPVAVVTEPEPDLLVEKIRHMLGVIEEYRANPEAYWVDQDNDFH